MHTCFPWSGEEERLSKHPGVMMGGVILFGFFFFFRPLFVDSLSLLKKYVYWNIYMLYYYIDYV